MLTLWLATGVLAQAETPAAVVADSGGSGNRRRKAKVWPWLVEEELDKRVEAEIAKPVVIEAAKPVEWLPDTRMMQVIRALDAIAARAAEDEAIRRAAKRRAAELKLAMEEEEDDFFAMMMH